MPDQRATRLAEIAAREAAATPGPWKYDPESMEVDGLRITTTHDDQGVFCEHEDGEFCAHARQDIPWLLARVAELEAELERMAFERGDAWDAGYAAKENDHD